MNFSSKSLFTIAAVVIVVAGLLWYFLATGGNAPPLSAAVAVPSSQTQFLSLAGQLAPVSFDTSIFSDPRFAALIDLSTPITPEPQGKNDPFGPFGAAPPPSAPSTASSTP